MLLEWRFRKTKYYYIIIKLFASGGSFAKSIEVPCY